MILLNSNFLIELKLSPQILLIITQSWGYWQIIEGVSDVRDCKIKHDRK